MTRRSLVMRPRAADDIVHVFVTIAADNPDAAERFLTAVRAEFELLAAFPHIGRARRFRTPEIRALRSRPISGFRSWLIFYRVDATSVDVVRILHGARDLPGALRE